MSLWVRLKQDRRLEVNGVNKDLKKGDWIEVGKQTANQWIIQGIADRTGYDVSKEYVDYTAGIVIVGGINQQLLNNIQQDIPGIEVSSSDKPEMFYSENMIWTNGINIRRENLFVGFKLLKNWQIAVPLHSYDDLAVHQTMTKSEKEYIKSVIKELRVPIYNTNLMFIRRCDETQVLLNQWGIEKEIIKNDSLSFHVAMYKTNPVLCALPVNWIG